MNLFSIPKRVKLFCKLLKFTDSKAYLMSRRSRHRFFISAFEFSIIFMSISISSFVPELFLKSKLFFSKCFVFAGIIG